MWGKERRRNSAACFPCLFPGRFVSVLHWRQGTDSLSWLPLLSGGVCKCLQVLQQLDQEGCIRVADLLKELPLSSVFVVGQAHSFVTEAFERMDTVVKKDGYSTIEITP